MTFKGFDDPFFDDIKRTQKRMACGTLLAFPAIIVVNLAILAIAVWVVVKVLQLTGVL